RGRRRPRRDADHRGAHARRLHDRQARGRAGLGGDRDAAPGRRRAVPARALPRTRGEGAHAVDPARHLPLGHRLRRKRDSGAGRRRHVRDVLHGRPVPPTRARLRPARSRARLPARDIGDGHVVAALHRAADLPLHRPRRAPARTRADRRRTDAVRPLARRWHLSRRRAASDGRHGVRNRRLDAGTDVTCDVGGDPRGRRPRVGSGQHLGPGRRCTRAGGPGDGVGDAQRSPRPSRRARRRGAHRRLPPCLPDRRGAGRGRGRDRRAHPRARDERLCRDRSGRAATCTRAARARACLLRGLPV
ncbi:MAG: Uncharacterized MFS-type transporter, partial [uncultured Solirubrobacterales bacterium]